MIRRIERLLKRAKYIEEMIKEGVTKKRFYINKRYEEIEITEKELKVIEIINDVIANEKTEWVKVIMENKQKGERDIKIIIESPVEGKKYYELRKRFIDKIYHCCIAKGLVTYEETLGEMIE